MRIIKILTLIFLVFLTGFTALSQEQFDVSAYKAVFTAPPQHVPTTKTPDAPLAGNGDIGITMGGTPDRLCFYIGKNDFWRAYPVYPGGGIALPGGLEVRINALQGASYYAEQKPDDAEILARFVKNDLKVELKSWVAATHNTILIELNANQKCSVNLRLWTPKGNTSVFSQGYEKGCFWVTRSFENTPLLEWPAHIAMALSMPGADLPENNTVELTPGKKTILAITIYTNQDSKEWKSKAINEAKSLTSLNVEKMYAEHLRWWTSFWSQSHISIGDSLIEKYYYASQYLLASTSRGDKFAPGIWGCFVTQDSTSWGGDYHLNYNYQAPYWAAFSSNHIDLTKNFDQPILDYMEKGKWHAKDLLNIKGIYYPVGLGPKGLCTTRWPLTPEEMEKRYGTTENTIDHGYKFLGQKINAVFSVGNMLMRFYTTYNEAYARKIYPYMLECANFWEDYLKLENGRYVIYMDHYGEVMPNLKNKGNWRDRLGDFNSTLSLGLVKMLFKGMTDVSTFLHQDAKRQEKWSYISAHMSDFPLGDNNCRISLKNMEKGPGNSDVKANGLSRVSIHGMILPGGVCGPVTDSAFNQILLGDVMHWKDRMTNPGEWGNTLGNGIETCFPAAVRVGYDPDDIIKQLKARIALQSFPNLWITATGGGLETLSAVPMTINEMLMQSYEGVIRIFPDWNPKRDASFETLRAYGAFLVSSSLKNGKIEKVVILSEKGNPVTLQNPWKNEKGSIKVTDATSKGPVVFNLKNGKLTFKTEANKKYLVTSSF
jgi:hypothetical protein